MAERGKIGSLDRIDLVERVRAKYAVHQYIPTRSYDPDTHAYALDDLGVGALYEVTPIASSDMADGSKEQVIERLASAFGRVPDHTIIQWILAPALNVDEDLNNFLNCGGSEHPVVSRYQDQMARHYRNSLVHPLFSVQYGEGGFYTKRWRVLLTLQVQPTQQVAGAKASIVDFIGSIFGKKQEQQENRASRSSANADQIFSETPAERRWNDLRRTLTKQLTATRRRIESSLRSSDLQIREIEPAELITIYQHILFPRSSAGRQAQWDPTRQIADQIPLADVIVDPAAGCMLVDGRVHMSVSLSSIPSSTKPGLLTTGQPGLNMHSFLDFLPSGFITVSASAIHKDDMRKFLADRKQAIAGGFVMQAQVEDLKRDQRIAEDMLEADNMRFFWTQVTINVTAATEADARELADKIRDKANDLGLDARVEQHYGPSLIFQSLPFGFAPRIPDLRRFMHLPDYAMLDFAPVLMQSRGTRNAAVLFHNRLGEPFRFNPFDSNAAHCWVVGDSGTGKSFAVSNMLLSIARQVKPKSQIWAFDKGGSFAPLTQILGIQHASYNNVDVKNPVCINCFAGTMATTSGFLQKFLKHLAEQSDLDKLTGQQIGLINACIKNAFLQRQDQGEWKDWDELRQRFPKGRWIAKARKRLKVKPLAPDIEAACQQSKAKEGSRDMEFEFYIRAVLEKRDHVDPEDNSKVKRTENCSRVDLMDKETRAWLLDQDYLLESVTDRRTGSERAAVLYQGRENERKLAAAGFSFHIMDSEWVLEVGRSEDLEDLCRLGVQPIFPDEFYTEVRAQVADLVDREHPTADESVRKDIITQHMEKVRPTDLFDWLPGTCTIQREVYFRDFIRELRGLEGRYREDVAKLLTAFQPYHSGGALAGFFDGETRFKFDGKTLITFELKELAQSGAHLQAAVVGALMQMILLYCQSEAFADGGPRSYTKYLVMDEFWELLGNPIVADLVINALKTARKFGLGLILISQLVDDFHKTEAGRTVLKSCQHKILLQQPETTVVQLDKMLEWPTERMALQSTVISAKGLFSEALIHIPGQNICEVVRITVPSYVYWLFTTDKDDIPVRREKVNRYRAQNMSQEEALARAVEDCAKLYPSGVARSKMQQR